MGAAAVEFRGVENLVYAEVTEDTLENYATGEVKILAPVAEISKAIEQSSSTSYYDNMPKIVINAAGADTITCTVAVLDLETAADITGQTWDEGTGALIEGTFAPKYFALGYKMGLTDGTSRYVWRLKGTFTQPEETSVTKDAGTDTNNQSVDFTGVGTIHRFVRSDGSAKSVVVDERDGKCDVSNWFDEVVTPDTLLPLTPVTPPVVPPGGLSDTPASLAVNSVPVAADSPVIEPKNNPVVEPVAAPVDSTMTPVQDPAATPVDSTTTPVQDPAANSGA